MIPILTALFLPMALIAAEPGQITASGPQNSQSPSNFPTKKITPPPGFSGFEWQNPIHFDEAAGPYGDRLRDPHIIRDGDTYYLTHSMTPVAAEENYDPFSPFQGSSPGVRLYSTKDFKTWKAESWIIKGDELPEDSPFRHQHFAPEINKIGGKFYLVDFAGNWKLRNRVDCYIGVADKITGPYKHFTQLKGAWCDVTLTEDDHGKVYAFMIGNGIRVREVDLSGIEQGDIKLVGPEKTAVDDTYFKKGLWHGRWTEGPWVKRRDGKYYLFYAVRLPGADSVQKFPYWMAVSYADHPMGPWTQDPNAGVFWGGHGAVFDGPDGRWWYSYKNGKFNAAYEDFLCIDPLDFLPDGRVAPGDPTPYNILTRIALDGTITRSSVDPKPVPVDQRPKVAPPKLLPAVTCPYPAKKIVDWDFQKAGDGSPLPHGPLAEGEVSFQNEAGAPVLIRAFAGTTGPVLSTKDGKRVLDTSGGNLFFPRSPASVLTAKNSNRYFSLWMRVQFLGDSNPFVQTVAVNRARWKVFRSKSGRLVADFGRSMTRVQGPELQLGRWYDIGFSFEGDADPADLHEDIVRVYLDGKEVGKATGRGMFDDSGNFVLGCGWDSGQQFFQGLYQRLIYWDGVATPEEIAALSNALIKKRL